MVLLGRQGSSSQCTLWGLAIWLFSPFTAVISTRGSGESLVTCMLLGMLAALGSGGRGEGVLGPRRGQAPARICARGMRSPWLNMLLTAHAPVV